MDHYSILDRSSASPALERELPLAGATRSATASVSAGIAAANAHPPKPDEPGPRFAGEDGGRSLAEMAGSDLDAALQLLVERAQYITGASGAAIALRRGEPNDMLCRASAGSCAPELGALLSTEYGLSGECVRTRQVLLCDDAERDPRVNREACRGLGIASVVVMPVVSGEQVLGVFELLSGTPRAFDERSVSALQRLSEMVETAVKHAAAAQVAPLAEARAVAGELDLAQSEAAEHRFATGAAPVESPGDLIEAGSGPAPAPPAEKNPPQEAEKAQLAGEPKPQPAAKKPLFWSAALRAQGSSAQSKASAESIAVPPGLRNLQKCQACGFPVSQGRTFCVECEEKQWREPRLPHSGRGAAPGAPGPREPKPEQNDQAPPEPLAAGPTPVLPEVSVLTNSSSAQRASAQFEAAAETLGPASALAPIPALGRSEEPAGAEVAIPARAFVGEAEVSAEGAKDLAGTESSGLFLSSTLHSESWFASNKYILATLLVVAIVIGALAWLR
jgi:hypothetical protein